MDLRGYSDQFYPDLGSGGIGPPLTTPKSSKLSRQSLLEQQKSLHDSGRSSDKYYKVASSSSTSVTSLSTQSNDLPLLPLTPELVRLSTSSSDSSKYKQPWPSITTRSTCSSDSKSVTSEASHSSNLTSNSASTHRSVVSSDKYISQGNTIRRSGRLSNQIQLDPLEGAFSSTSKLRLNPNTPKKPSLTVLPPSPTAASLSTVSTFDIDFIEINPKSSESSLPAPVCPSPSSSSTPENADIRTRASMLFMKSLVGSKSPSSQKQTNLATPGNKLPPLGHPSSSSSSLDPTIKKPTKTSPGRKGLPEPPTISNAKMRPSSKPRPLSARMSSLISIFSRSDSNDSIPEEPIQPPPTSTSREAANASLAGSRRASSRASSRLSRKLSSNLDAQQGNGIASMDRNSNGFTIRNLDTGQIFDLDRLTHDVPTTISPQLLFNNNELSSANFGLPPLMSDIPTDGRDGYAVRSL